MIVVCSKVTSFGLPKSTSLFLESQRKYRLRTWYRKEGGLTPTIEEYNYDFYATGKVKRPPVMEKYEAEMSKIYRVSVRQRSQKGNLR
jgi:hypothetical protein